LAKGDGGKYQDLLDLHLERWRLAISAAAARMSASILVSSASAGWRKSTVDEHRGREWCCADCGWLSTTPMVERPFGRLPIRRHSTISSAARPAHRGGPSIGVVAGVAFHAGQLIS